MLGLGGGSGSGLASRASVNFDVEITMWGGGGGGYVRKSSPAWGPPIRSGKSGHSLIAKTTYENLGLNSGNTLTIYVGGGGQMPGPGGPNGGHPGGGGNGNGGYGGGGGGMSTIYMNGTFSTGTLLLLTAGGGGGGSNWGEFGNNLAGTSSGGPGRGATPTSGGTGGPGVSGSGPGTPGSQYQGGNSGAQGGGGGSGFYGGGGGPGDGGAANGGPGGNGLSYGNPTYFANDTSDSGTNDTNGIRFSNMFLDFPSFDNSFRIPGAPLGPGPFYYPGYQPYNRPPGSTASDTIPAENGDHPLYNDAYGGRSPSGGSGAPGSVFITINGTTYSYTSVGTYTLTLP